MCANTSVDFALFQLKHPLLGPSRHGTPKPSRSAADGAPDPLRTRPRRCARLAAAALGRAGGHGSGHVLHAQTQPHRPGYAVAGARGAHSWGEPATRPPRPEATARSPGAGALAVRAHRGTRPGAGQPGGRERRLRYVAAPAGPTARPPRSGGDGGGSPHRDPRPPPHAALPLPLPGRAPSPVPPRLTQARGRSRPFPPWLAGPRRGRGDPRKGRGRRPQTHARTRSRALRLRVGPRDAHPESPPVKQQDVKKKKMFLVGWGRGGWLSGF